ncbi:hypothetical protein BCT76_17995 [Vibrio tasmaniensis]|uniref:AMP-binding protein n=1 Tax=Vibrio tasmaniensis TaxID=212663 RepID=UPI000C824F0F|nr:AMP-binding protein [Vibrio tasmaniensis]PML45371.1 hypothetical protein BCT76_17995 [Vibrio tasmaniensis]
MPDLSDNVLFINSELPQQEAIHYQGKTYTYDELTSLIEEFVVVLSKVAFSQNRCLALLLEPSPEAIAIMVACSKLDITFTVVDLEAPKKRIDNQLQNLGAEYLIARNESGEITYDYSKELILFNISLFRTGIVADVRCELKSALYVLFTSGTTGCPKGIIMGKDAVLKFFKALVDDFSMATGTRYLTSSPLHFDYSILDIFLCLGSGGVLYVPTRDTVKIPMLLSRFITKNRIQHFSGVPTLWKQICKYCPETLESMHELERVVFAGEAFPAPIINKIRNYKNSLEFYNIYGQSESIACTTYLIPENLPEGTKYLPVGTGLHGVTMVLVDYEGNLISEANTDGELYISGDILFDGYLNLPDVNEKKLVTPRFSPGRVFFKTGDCCFFDCEGIFYFKGRLDNQVQINGSRVELDEIEAVISHHEHISNVCALLFNGTLVCFISLSDPRDNEQVRTELKEQCRHSLPYYMRPERYIVIEEMPITNNGKNDRERLKEILNCEELIYEP